MSIQDFTRFDNICCEISHKPLARRAAGNASLKAGLGPWDEGSETYQVWRGISIDEASAERCETKEAWFKSQMRNALAVKLCKAAELKVCWCNEAAW